MPRCSTAPSVPALDQLPPARAVRVRSERAPGVGRFLGTWRPLALAGALVLAGQLVGAALEQHVAASGPGTVEAPSESAPLLPASAPQSDGATLSDDSETESGVASRAS